MSLKNYFSGFILFPSLLMLSHITIASVIEAQCGKSFFQVKTYNRHDISEMRYELYYKINNRQEKLLYKTDTGVFFHIACIKNKKKDELILFQEYCSGNACQELTYGLIESNTKNIIIKPADWPNGNYQQVEKLIGYPPPFLPDYNKAFCCSKEQG